MNTREITPYQWFRSRKLAEFFGLAWAHWADEMCYTEREVPDHWDTAIWKFKEWANDHKIKFETKEVPNCQGRSLDHQGFISWRVQQNGAIDIHYTNEQTGDNVWSVTISPKDTWDMKFTDASRHHEQAVRSLIFFWCDTRKERLTLLSLFATP